MKFLLAQNARLAAVMIFSMIVPVVAHGALIAIEDNNVLKSASTTVQGGTPLGQDTTFTIKEVTAAQTNARLGFLKFDLSTIPVSSSNAAVFTVTSANSVASSYRLTAYALNSAAPGFNWSESSITYANRPALIETDPLIDLTKATVVGSFINVASSAASGINYSFSFADLENYRLSDNTMTLILVATLQSNTGSSFNFASSENATAASRPSLEVTAVPEPATTALLGLGLIGLFMWQRRK